jgi:hypothetical protein
MATVDELRELHVLGPEMDADDAVLGALIDALGLNGALARLWAEQASKTAVLVDITESGSSRKMSQLHSQAANLAASYRSLAEAEGTSTTSTATTRRMSR